MYLFTRSARLAPGNTEKAITWAVQITEKVNQLVEFEPGLWSRVFSPGYGTLVWTATVEDLALLESGEAKMLADPGYISLVDQGAQFSSGDPIDDGVVQLVFADPASAEVDAKYATVVQALLAPGKSVRGVELGVEIAQRAGSITGCPTSFGVATTGAYGLVEWVSVYASIEQLQHGQQTLAADTGFAQLMDKEVSQAYQSNAVQNTYRRIV
jgi:hypothetical protein